jgi:putative oxidoreductase
MTLSSSCLLLGGVASFLILFLHLALALRPQWYRYFGADELAQMHEQGSRFTMLVTLGLALMFALWGAYALAGAGVIGQLPLLRTVLIAIGAT